MKVLVTETRNDILARDYAVKIFFNLSAPQMRELYYRF